MNTMFTSFWVILLLVLQDDKAWWIDKILWAIIIIGGAILAALFVLSRKRQDVHEVETKRANANADLVKTRDIRIADLEKEVANLKEDYAAVQGEYKILGAIDINALFEFWAIKESIELENRNLKTDKRILESRVTDLESRLGIKNRE